MFSLQAREYGSLKKKPFSDWRAVHDHFDPQPAHDASIFFLRLVLHDWPFDNARKILKHLRAAAMPDTVLVILEHVLPYACATGTAADVEVDVAPRPLLPNYGAANSLGYGLDIVVRSRGHPSSPSALWRPQCFAHRL